MKFFEKFTGTKAPEKKEVKRMPSLYGPGNDWEGVSLDLKVPLEEYESKPMPESERVLGPEDKVRADARAFMKMREDALKARKIKERLEQVKRAEEFARSAPPMGVQTGFGAHPYDNGAASDFPMRTSTPRVTEPKRGVFSRVARWFGWGRKEKKLSQPMA